MENSSTTVRNNLSPYPNNSDDSNSDEGVIASHEALLPKNNRHREFSGDGVHSGKRRSRGSLVRHRQQSGGERGPGLIDNLTPNIDPEMAPPETKIVDDISMCRKYMSVFVLFLINLLNYMDRFTIAGVLLNIQRYFGITNASAGLLQTVFIISYMIVAPIFGYLGDRYNRKIVMLVGMLVWSGCTLLASFVSDKDHFPYFLALRGLVGVGEASYSTIAPTIIADLFVKSKRTRMLSVFFFAIPVGSGLGYIVGSAASTLGGSWHWSLRVTPGLGLITMILMMIIIPNPKRGASETPQDLANAKRLVETRSSYKEDLIYIFKNRSFMCITVGFTFMAFVVGSLTIWGPVFVAYSQIVVGAIDPCTDDNCEYGNVSFIFGLITCLAGFLGVWIGAESAKKWKERGQKNADALVCAIGLILAAPLLLCGFQTATITLPGAWTFIFFADLCLCLTWTLVGDMTLYVTMPSRRSTANAVQILTMHLFGDAGSPYLLGVMSDSLTNSMPDTYYAKFIGLQRAIYVTLFAAVLGGCGFLMASLFLMIDKKKVDDSLAVSGTSSFTSSTSSSPPASSDSSGSVELNSFPPSNAPLLDEPSAGERAFCYTDNSINGDYSDRLLQQQENRLIDNRSEPTPPHSTSPQYITVGVGPRKVVMPESDLENPAEDLTKHPISNDRLCLPARSEGRGSMDSDQSDESTSSSLLLLRDAKESDI